MMLANRLSVMSGGTKSLRSLGPCELCLDGDSLNGADASLIDSWSDVSGKARHAVKAADSTRPAVAKSYVNGHTAALFTRASNTLLTLPNAFGALSAAEMFVVIKDGVGFEQCPLNMGAGGVNYELFPYSANAHIYDDWGSSTRKDTGVSVATLTNWNIYNVVSTATEWTSRLNGVQQYTTGTNAVGWTTIPKVGAAGTLFFNGWIAYYVVYSAKLSTPNRSYALRKLGGKYGVAVTP